MARYKMTVVFDVHEEVEMKYVHLEEANHEDEARGIKKTHPHINKLYEDVIERIETSPKYPITYDIVSFEKLT